MRQEYITVLITFLAFLFIWQKHISQVGYEYEWKNKVMGYLMTFLGVFSILMQRERNTPVQVLLGVLLIAGGLYHYFKVKIESFEDIQLVKLENVEVVVEKNRCTIQGTDADNNKLSYDFYGKDKRYGYVIETNNIKEILIEIYSGTGRILSVQIPKK